MIRKTALIAGVLLMVLGTAVLQAEIIRTTEYGQGADTYLSNDSQQGPTTNMGTEVRMRAWRQLVDTRSKIAYIRFDISEVTGSKSGATLTLWYTYMKGGASTIQVYGVNDGPGDYWIESGEGGVTYNTAVGLIPNPPTTLGNGVVDAANATLLGTLASPGVMTLPYSVTSDPLTLDLTAFLNADTNGLVTFFFIGPNDEDEIATKENTTYDPPTLTMPNAALGGAELPVPADDSTVNRSFLTQLQWSLIEDLNINRVEVYFGTEPNLPEMDRLEFAPAVESVNIDDFPSFSTPLAEGTYYWRVDCDNDANLADPNFPGSFWSFTATSAPIVSQQTAPEFQAKFVGETAEFTVAFSSTTTITYTWYRSNDNANNTPGDDTVVGGNSDTLTLTNLTAADAGYYYCKAANPGETFSNPVRLSIKKLYAHWALDGNATDSSGNGLDGTLFGSPVFDAGAVSQGMIFDGVDDYIREPNDFADFAPGVTISVWAKPAVVTNWARFLDFANGPASDNIFLSRNASTTNLSFNVYRGATSIGLTTATDVIEVGEWQMFVATLNESGNVVIYKNGLPIQTGTVTGRPNVITRTSCLVGDSNWTDDALYNGMMDDIYLYNYAITEDNVADMYSGVVGDYCRYKPALDWDNDCIVDFDDFATFAESWLECGLYPNCSL